MAPDPKKLLHGNDGKSYPTAAVLAAIEEEDKAAGGGTGGGGKRKTKHCVPRMTEVLCDPRWKRDVSAMRTQLSKAELDDKKTNKTRDIRLLTWEAFKDPKVKVRTRVFFGVNRVAGRLSERCAGCCRCADVDAMVVRVLFPALAPRSKGMMACCSCTDLDDHGEEEGGGEDT